MTDRTPRIVILPEELATPLRLPTAPAGRQPASGLTPGISPWGRMLLVSWIPFLNAW